MSMSVSASFCLFLGDLSLFCTEKDILEAFSVYGHVTNVRIKRSSENKKHLLYGFVEYSSAAEAVQAMQAMNGSLFLGRTLRVRWASNKQGKKVNNESEPNTPHGPSVFVVFLVYHKNAVVTEMQLRNVFQAYGNVDDVVVKQSKTDPITGQQKGYAFVQYTTDWAGVDAAMQAAATLDNAVVEGVGYKCEVSYHTEELRRYLIANNVPHPSGMVMSVNSGGMHGNPSMHSTPMHTPLANPLPNPSPSPPMISMMPSAPMAPMMSMGAYKPTMASMPHHAHPHHPHHLAHPMTLAPQYKMEPSPAPMYLPYPPPSNAYGAPHMYTSTMQYAAPSHPHMAMHPHAHATYDPTLGGSRDGYVQHGYGMY